MGYVKVLQFGDITEIYEYEKNIRHHKRPHMSALDKRRAKEKRDFLKRKGLYGRMPKNKKRTVDAFFRLCHHNNCKATTISFLTLTFAYDLTFKEASRNVAEFFRRLKKTRKEISLHYISVPEITKEGRYHFHILVYDLPAEISQSERTTRNLQRLFQRGYLDISPATYTSAGIAGYMAKYMAKAFSDARIESTRVYNCSRGIAKIYNAGGNSIRQYLDMIIPTVDIVKQERVEYDAHYLGRCLLTRIQTQHAK